MTYKFVDADLLGQVYTAYRNADSIKDEDLHQAVEGFQSLITALKALGPRFDLARLELERIYDGLFAMKAGREWYDKYRANSQSRSSHEQE